MLFSGGQPKVLLMRFTRLLLLTVLVVFLTSSIAQALQLVSVSRSRVNMRTGPGKNYAVLWELGLGYPLRVLGSKGNWLKVADFEGDTGWIYKKLVSKKPHLIVKKKQINIRKNPGTRNAIVGKAKYGVVLQTVKRGKGWVKVRHQNGLTGWVKRDLLWGW